MVAAAGAPRSPSGRPLRAAVGPLGRRLGRRLGRHLERRLKGRRRRLRRSSSAAAEAARHVRRGDARGDAAGASAVVRVAVPAAGSRRCPTASPRGGARRGPLAGARPARARVAVVVVAAADGAEQRQARALTRPGVVGALRLRRQTGSPSSRRRRRRADIAGRDKGASSRKWASRTAEPTSISGDGIVLDVADLDLALEDDAVADPPALQGALSASPLVRVMKATRPSVRSQRRSVRSRRTRDHAPPPGAAPRDGTGPATAEDGRGQPASARPAASSAARAHGVLGAAEGQGCAVPCAG